MQGKRGRIGSLPEILEFDSGSTSTDEPVDQQICRDSMRNPVENQMHQFMLSTGDMNPLYANSINRDWKSANYWRIGEPSSSSSHSQINNGKQKRELGWSSSTSADAVAGSRVKRNSGSTNLLSLDNVNSSPLFMNNSNSHSVTQSINLNASSTDTGCSMGQLAEQPGLGKSNVSVNEPVPPSVGFAPFYNPSGSNTADNNSVRPGSTLDARRVSCKRKAVEGYVGQSSGGESSSYSQCTESSAWHTLPTQSNSQSSVSRSSLFAHIGLRTGHDVGNEVGDKSSESTDNLNAAGSSNSVLRNSRLRTSSSNQQDSISYIAFSNGNATRHSTIPSSSPTTQSFHPVGSSLDLRSAPYADNMVSQSSHPAGNSFAQCQPLGTSASLHRNIPTSRWRGGSMLWPDRDNLPLEEGSSRSMHGYPMFIPVADLRNSVRSTTNNRASSSANLNISGNATSSLRAASSSAINSPSAPSWVSRPNLLHHPQRSSDYAHRSLLSTGSEAAGGFSYSNPFMHSASIASSEARAPSSRAGRHGRNQSHLRSSWMERRGDSNLRLPYSLQALAVASEGNSRLVSEVILLLTVFLHQIVASEHLVPANVTKK